jgi:hypothetical protein
MSVSLEKIYLGRSLLFLQGPVYTFRIRSLPSVPRTLQEKSISTAIYFPRATIPCPVDRFRSDGNRGRDHPAILGENKSRSKFTFLAGSCVHYQDPDPAKCTRDPCKKSKLVPRFIFPERWTDFVLDSCTNQTHTLLLTSCATREREREREREKERERDRDRE